MASVLRLAALAVLCASAAVSASRFTFSLPSRTEECFLEDVNARSSDNKLLFRFGILEPEMYDVMAVAIRSPSWKLVEEWNKTQANHVTSTVRETGLYHLCFKKLAGSSKDFNVYYSFDFISSGSQHMVLYPNLAGTLSKTSSDSVDYTAVDLVTAKGASTKVGIVDYSLSGISESIVRANTRVQLLVSVERVSSAKVDISIAQYKQAIQYPLSWDMMRSHVVDGYRQHVFDTAPAELGNHLAFDVTERFAEALNAGKSSLTFTLHAAEDADVGLTGMSYTTPDYYPQLIVEDMGLDLMREVAFFKERVFTLRGDITYIKQNERSSRNAAESANGRVKYMSLLTNVVLIGIALAQVLYIRTMLEGSY